MTRLSWLFTTILFCAASTARAKALPPDNEIIRYMKAYPVAKIDRRLGSGTYESWLRKTLGPWKSIGWIVDDCGEGGDGATETPVCVSTDVQIDSCRNVHVSMVVGSTNGGISGVPEVWTIERSGVTPTDEIDSLVHLEPAMRRAQALEPEFAARRLAPIDANSAIAYAQEIPARRLSPALPATPLAQWIANLAGPRSRITWKLGPGVSGSDLDGCNDAWATVEISAADSLESFIVPIRVGTFRRGIFGEPVAGRINFWNKRINKIDSIDLTSLEAHVESIRRPR